MNLKVSLISFNAGAGFCFSCFLPGRILLIHSGVLNNVAVPFNGHKRELGALCLLQIQQLCEGMSLSGKN